MRCGNAVLLLAGWLLAAGLRIELLGQEAVPSSMVSEGTDGREKLPADEEVRPSQRFPASWYPAGDGVTRSARPVTGKPYEAISYVLDLLTPDRPEQDSVQMRDRWGRTRSEEIRPAHDGSWNESSEARRRISVDDPASHCRFTWFEVLHGPRLDSPVAVRDCSSRRVHFEAVTPFGSFDESMGAEWQVRHEGRNGKTVLRDEPLGRRMVNGVEALGTRRTASFPKEGSGEPDTSGGETWWAPTFRQVVLMRSVIGGAEISEIGYKKIRLVEPDAAKFYPPAGYRIVKEGEAVP